MGETVRWAQNCLRIFELIKSVNGKGIHSAGHISSFVHSWSADVYSLAPEQVFDILDCL